MNDAETIADLKERLARAEAREIEQARQCDEHEAELARLRASRGIEGELEYSITYGLMLRAINGAGLAAVVDALSTLAARPPEVGRGQQCSVPGCPVQVSHGHADGPPEVAKGETICTAFECGKQGNCYINGVWYCMDHRHLGPAQPPPAPLGERERIDRLERAVLQVLDYPWPKETLLNEGEFTSHRWDALREIARKVAARSGEQGD